MAAANKRGHHTMATKKRNAAAADLHHDRLAEEVKARRVELGLTQETAAELTAKIDVKVFEADRKSPGISRSTWGYIEQGAEVNRFAHTLALLDATLRWPEGTARAHLYGLDLPDGPPVDITAATGRNHNGSGHHPDEAAARVETARALRDVADLRYEVAQLAETVARLARLVEGGSK